MNNLSKEKKQQLAFVAMITLVIVAGIWFGLINSQKLSLADAQKRTAAARDKVAAAEKLIKRTDELQDELAKVQGQLSLREDTMASGDLYQWILSRIITVTTGRPLNNFNADPPKLVDAMLLPKFPYRAASYPVRISGYYHDLGRFIADLENEFPFARIQNVEVTPTPGQVGEKLNLNFEFVSLYQTNRAISIK